VSGNYWEPAKRSYKCVFNNGETMARGSSGLRKKKVHSPEPYDVSNVSKLACSHHFARNAENR
jgi:hypothetical protein